jgi:hypothetical protein
MKNQTKRCHFWNHDWTRWWDTNGGTIHPQGRPDITTGNFVVQTRVCSNSNCHKRQIRRITA